GVREYVVRAREPELADREGGMRALERRRRVEERLDLVLRLRLVALQVELDEGCAAVARDLTGVGRVERRPDDTDVLLAQQRRDEVRDGDAKRGVADRRRLGLDENALGRGALEVRRREDLLGLTRAARGGVGVLDLLRAECPAGHDRENRECEPGG